MAIIGIFGAIGEGKDLFASLLVKHAKKQFEHKKFAQKLKQIVALLTNVDVANFESDDFKNQIVPGDWKHPETGEKITYRFLLQYVGTDLFRDRLDTDVWVNSLFSGYNGRKDNYIITDMRFLNEARAIKKRKGITIRVIRYKTVREWLESSYFQNLFYPNYTDNLIDSYKDDKNKISKHEMIAFVCRKKNHIPVENRSNFEKMIHPSETELHDAKFKFDYVIRNDSTVEDFENKVSDFVQSISRLQ